MRPSSAQLLACFVRKPSNDGIVEIVRQSDRFVALERSDIGVWLAPADDPSLLAEDAATLPVVAVDFPKFADGRGYSIARLLRERLFFKGELRAVGDVARDQLYYLHQVGFDAFLVRAGKDAQDALASLRDFTDGYQVTNRRTPWFRRSDTDLPLRHRSATE